MKYIFISQVKPEQPVLETKEYMQALDEDERRKIIEDFIYNHNHINQEEWDEVQVIPARIVVKRTTPRIEI